MRNFEDHISGNLKVLNARRIKLPAPNNTASPPHKSNASVVKVPPELLGGLPEQHEALRVRHDLARVQGLHSVPMR